MPERPAASARHGRCPPALGEKGGAGLKGKERSRHGQEPAAGLSGAPERAVRAELGHGAPAAGAGRGELAASAEPPGAAPGTCPRLLGMAGAARGAGPRCPAVSLLLGALLCGGKRGGTCRRALAGLPGSRLALSGARGVTS